MSTKTKKSAPKLDEMTEEQIRAFMKKKRECDTKAQSIVMEMLNESIKEDVFISCLPHISQSHYDDITVERSIVKLCGYPLCGNTLSEKVPGQTYKICMNTNKVYDITNRKNFCSNQCYKSSNHIKEQILTSPLWYRKESDIPKFNLLPLNTKGSLGEVVDLSITEKIKVEDKSFTSMLDFTEASLNEIKLEEDSNKIISEYERSSKNNQTKQRQGLKVNKDENKCNIKEKVEEKQLKSNVKKGTIIIRDVVERKCENRIDPIIKAGQDLIKSKAKDAEKLPVPKNKTISNDANCNILILQIEKALGEWFTFDTLLYLFGESKVKEMVADKNDAIKEYLNNLSCGMSSSSVSYDQYQKLYRKLNILELEDKKYDQEVIDKRELKPLPDYSMVQEESRILELKVRSYFKGDTSIPNSKIEKEEQNEDEWSPNLPLVDKHSQYLLRRKIVSNGLDKVLPDLLKALKLSAREISGDVRDLINTFNLQAHNITFKFTQWNFIAILIIKLLSIRSAKLKDKLDVDAVYKHLELLLLSYELDSCYLDRLIWWLTDIDRLLEVDPVGILK